MAEDTLLLAEQKQFDVILCLSVTKWLHLNWGDAGLKQAFRRMYAQLKPGGKLILEPQSWRSYKNKKTLTETIYNNYNSIEFFPEKFTQYLLSSEVGFAKSEIMGHPNHPSKGFQRSIQIFTKSDLSPSQSQRSYTATPSSNQTKNIYTSLISPSPLEHSTATTKKVYTNLISPSPETETVINVSTGVYTSFISPNDKITATQPPASETDTQKCDNKVNKSFIQEVTFLKSENVLLETKRKATETTFSNEVVVKKQKLDLNDIEITSQGRNEGSILTNKESVSSKNDESESKIINDGKKLGESERKKISTEFFNNEILEEKT